MHYPDLPNLLVSEAADLPGVSEKTIRRWHHEDLFDGTRLNGSLWIDRKSLVELIEPNRGCGDNG
jgi:hypothetical protein